MIKMYNNIIDKTIYFGKRKRSKKIAFGIFIQNIRRRKRS